MEETKKVKKKKDVSGEEREKFCLVYELDNVVFFEYAAAVLQMQCVPASPACLDRSRLGDQERAGQHWRQPNNHTICSFPAA